MNIFTYMNSSTICCCCQVPALINRSWSSSRGATALFESPSETRQFRLHLSYGDQLEVG